MSYDPLKDPQWLETTMRQRLNELSWVKMALGGKKDQEMEDKAEEAENSLAQAAYHWLLLRVEAGKYVPQEGEALRAPAWPPKLRRPKD